MNIENNCLSSIPEKFRYEYAEDIKKYVFHSCDPEDRCIDFEKEFVRIEKMISLFLDKSGDLHWEKAEYISKKLFENCQKIPVHEYSCSVQKYKRLLSGLHSAFFAYHLNKEKKQWFNEECKRLFDSYRDS